MPETTADALREADWNSEDAVIRDARRQLTEALQKGNDAAKMGKRSACYMLMGYGSGISDRDRRVAVRLVELLGRLGIEAKMRESRAEGGGGSDPMVLDDTYFLFVDMSW
jgi:hypothetical protein